MQESACGRPHTDAPAVVTISTMWLHHGCSALVGELICNMPKMPAVCTFSLNGCMHDNIALWKNIATPLNSEAAEATTADWKVDPYAR
jgi:hypothetical protein